MEELDTIGAHRFSIRHRESIQKSPACGCFYCLAIFTPNDITEWVDIENGEGQTALCPKCGIDSVIGSDSSFPISLDFLTKMQQHWF
jgi:hypothetical protein